MADRRFELVCEIEPPTRPDLTRVRHQIGVLSLVADSFLIPDNHIGRATVSSVAVAHEVQAMGARGIACLRRDITIHLGQQRLGQHPPGTLPHDLIDQRRRAVLPAYVA